MAILYRIKPVDKKSIEAYYDVYSKDEQGNILKKAKSAQTISRYVQKIAEENLSK